MFQFVICAHALHYYNKLNDIDDLIVYRVYMLCDDLLLHSPYIISVKQRCVIPTIC